MALRLRGATSGYIELKAPASAGDNTLTLPTNNGSANQLLKTDGSGNLSWTDDNSGVSLSGSTNNTIATVTGANALQGESNLTFDGNNLAMSGTGVFTITRNSRTLTLEGNYGNEGHPAVKTSAGHDLRIFTNGNNEKVRITSTGKVGINEDVPQSTLHVASTSNYVDIGLSNSTSGHTGSDGANIFLNNSLELGLWNRESTGVIRFATAGTERLRITSDGVVGIGSSSPGSSSKVFSYQSDASAGNNIILENNYSANNTTTLLKAYRLGGAVGYALQYKDSTTRMRQGTYTNHPMELITNDNARITIANDGHCVFSNSIALNAETAAANRLDDYEEGSYTPAVDAWAGETVDFGYYVKVGSLVNVWGGVQDPSSVTANTPVEISLPFTPSSNTHGMGGAGNFMSENVSFDSSDQMTIYVKPGDAKFRLYHLTDGGWATLDGNHCGTNSLIWFHTTYYV